MKYDWFVLVNEKDVSSGCSYSICSLFRLTHFKFAKNYKCWVLRSYSAPKQIERYFIFINLLLFFYLVVSICVHREIIMDELNSIFCTEHQNELLRSIVYLFERSLARCLSLCVFPFAKYRNNKSTFRFGRMRVLMTDSHFVPKFVSHRSFHYFYLNWCSQATCVWQRCSSKGMSSVRHAWDSILLAAFALSPSVTLCPWFIRLCTNVVCALCVRVYLHRLWWRLTFE